MTQVEVVVICMIFLDGQYLEMNTKKLFLQIYLEILLLKIKLETLQVLLIM